MLASGSISSVNSAGFDTTTGTAESDGLERESSLGDTFATGGVGRVGVSAPCEAGGGLLSVFFGASGSGLTAGGFAAGGGAIGAVCPSMMRTDREVSSSSAIAG